MSMFETQFYKTDEGLKVGRLLPRQATCCLLRKNPYTIITVSETARVRNFVQTTRVLLGTEHKTVLQSLFTNLTVDNRSQYTVAMTGRNLILSLRTYKAENTCDATGHNELKQIKKV